MAIEAVIEEALKLSLEERAEVISRLMESIDEHEPDDPGHDAAWAEVIDRRLQEARVGRIELVDAADALATAHTLAASRRR